MSVRFFAAMLGLVLVSNLSPASALPPYDAPTNSWNSTHVVVVEGGKVVESWKGNLKVGDALPEGAARFTRLPVPGFAKELFVPDKTHPEITGKRLILFLAYVPILEKDEKKRFWMGADAPGLPSNSVSPTAVAWLEGDKVYTVCQQSRPGPYVLEENGRVAGLRQSVSLGIAIRAQFDAAKSDADPEARAARLIVLISIVSKCAGSYGRSDCFEELGKCGKSAMPYLADWVLEPKAELADDALSTLTRLGDVGFDGMLKIVDAETKYWKAVADDLFEGEWVDQRTHTNDIYRWRGPNRLRSILNSAHSMKLSAENRQRLSKHAGLIELEKTLRTKQGMKPEKTDMEAAHKILQDILAGKFRKDG